MFLSKSGPLIIIIARLLFVWLSSVEGVIMYKKRARNSNLEQTEILKKNYFIGNVHSQPSCKTIKS